MGGSPSGGGDNTRIQKRGGTSGTHARSWESPDRLSGLVINAVGEVPARDWGAPRWVGMRLGRISKVGGTACLGAESDGQDPMIVGSYVVAIETVCPKIIL